MVDISEKNSLENLLKHKETDSDRDSVTCDPVKIRLSESKAEVEVEESTNNKSRFQAWGLVCSSVSASNTTTLDSFELMAHDQFMTFIFDIH